MEIHKQLLVQKHSLNQQHYHLISNKALNSTKLKIHYIPGERRPLATRGPLTSSVSKHVDRILGQILTSAKSFQVLHSYCA